MDGLRQAPAPPPPEHPMSYSVHHQDWREFMAGITDKSVDLVLTDPPYAISRTTGFANVGKFGIERFAVSMDFGKWDHKEIDLPAFCREAYRTLRQGGTAIVWYDIWKIGELRAAMESAGFKMIRLIVWQKTNPVPLNQHATYLSNSREVAVCAVRGGTPTFHSKYDKGIYESPIPRHSGRRDHPTQKPVDLFAELVNKHSNVGDIVIDPFVGSGTTGVAAIGGGANLPWLRHRCKVREDSAKTHCRCLDFDRVANRSYLRS